MDSVPAGSRFLPSQVAESYLYDGIDHPLRIKRGSTAAYYELDLAGNVRGLRASGGADLGSYRYTAFGKTVEDTTTFDQPLRWKARWFSNVAGGIYDVRARQWSPELGAFLAVDEFEFHDVRTTLWGWPNQSPVRLRDPSGRWNMTKDRCRMLALGGAVVCGALCLTYLKHELAGPGCFIGCLLAGTQADKEYCRRFPNEDPPQSSCPLPPNKG